MVFLLLFLILFNYKKGISTSFEILFCDETTLKTMIRSNPGIMILNNGTIVEKKNWRDIADIKL